MNKKTAESFDSQMLASALLLELGFILCTWLLQKQLGHQQKLYYHIRLIYLGVLALAERSRDIDTEIRD